MFDLILQIDTFIHSGGSVVAAPRDGIVANEAV